MCSRGGRLCSTVLLVRIVNIVVTAASKSAYEHVAITIALSSLSGHGLQCIVNDLISLWGGPRVLPEATACNS